jgi:hypothetical protein
LLRRIFADINEREYESDEEELGSRLGPGSTSMQTHTNSGGVPCKSTAGGVELAPTRTCTNVNATLLQKMEQELKRIPLEVVVGLPGLQGKCLGCMSKGVECSSHETHKCKHWGFHKYEGHGAFEWKKEFFCNSGDKGYCYRCLLNPDHNRIHEGKRCVYAGIVFEIVWLVMHNSDLRKSLGRHMRHSGLEEQKEFGLWVKRMYDGKDRKWRNCGTHLIVWFHKTFAKECR